VAREARGEPVTVGGGATGVAAAPAEYAGPHRPRLL